MADWSKNNRACTTLWTTLFITQQLITNFDDSGELAMNDLTFFNPLDSADSRKQAATLLADQLDNTFRNGGFSAILEAEIDRTKAVSGMVEILTDKDKLVKDLAENVDSSYIFWGEK